MRVRRDKAELLLKYFAAHNQSWQPVVFLPVLTFGFRQHFGMIYCQIIGRKFIIAAIVLVAIIGLLILNRQRLKSRYQQQLAFQQKVAAEKEMTAAKEQLIMFTQSIIEKTKLIEKLEQQVANKPLTDEQQQLATELSHQTLLTEEDWQKFKTLFEKIYPGFYLKLKEMVPDITVAEYRMAALTRLHLNTKQMASMPGISPDSVYKIRQRLRKRLQLNDEVAIDLAKI